MQAELKNDPYKAFREGNPFTDEFVAQELEFYGAAEYSRNGVRCIDIEYCGFAPDYLNKNFRLKTATKVLTIDGQTWMSLTPMEIESNYLPIYESHGDVYAGGLGMGYFALRSASKKEVSKVIVYELDKRVIDFFEATHKHREEFKKIEIRNRDWREALRSGEIPRDAFIYSDIYLRLCGGDVLSDAVEFAPKYQMFRFWGMELVILSAVLHHGIRSPLFGIWLNLRDFLRKFAEQEKSDMFEPLWDASYCAEIMSALDGAEEL